MILQVESNRALVISFFIASIIEICLLLSLSRQRSPPSGYQRPMPEIEAEILESQATHHPPNHLTEESVRSTPRAPEPILGRGEGANASALPTENQAEKSAGQPPSHGPLLLVSPAPKLPSYLRDQNLRANVLIEFVIGATGVAVAHLLGTSGNEELDALALKSAREWKFAPATEDHRPIASKVRLRINFEVQ